MLFRVLSEFRNRTGRPRETIKFHYDNELPNAPGMSIVAIQVDYVPNGFTPPHRHGGATVSVLVTKGQVLSGMNGNPPKVYGAGETFAEMPGCHHTVSENYSESEPASLMATLVVDTETVKKGYHNLTVVDEGWE
jgi:quercetin dioxygenase-like cupin family protein